MLVVTFETNLNNLLLWRKSKIKYRTFIYFDWADISFYCRYVESK